MAQIRLFWDAWQNPQTSPYTILWLNHGKIPYLIMGLLGYFYSPEKAGRLAMLALGVLWIIGIFSFAKKFNRPLANAILASLFFFSHLMYYGFYNFVAGLPFFLLWIYILSKDTWPVRWTMLLLLLFGGLLLYWCHVLWLVAGLFWLVVCTIFYPPPRRVSLWRFVFILPLLILMIFWYKFFSASEMFNDSMIIWFNPLQKLSPFRLIDAALGGNKLGSELVLFGFCLLWVIVSFLEDRSRFFHFQDRKLLLLGATLFLLVLALPSRFMGTISFCERWMPPAMVMLLLAVPAPKFSRVYLRSIVAILLVAFFIKTTTLAWKNFEFWELSGLAETLEVLPKDQRVLGLSPIQRSRFIKNTPFIQVFAYAQALKGGSLSFSFAEFASSLVVFKKIDLPHPWTHFLEWYPEAVKQADFNFFDMVIINTVKQDYARFESKYPIKPLTTTGHWRLYQVIKKE